MANMNDDGPGRREARERAIALLYEAETKKCGPVEVLDDLPALPMVYTSDAIRGFGEHGDEIDQLIEEHSNGWRLARMPAMDRAILRIATWELIHRPDVPRAVVLDEAIDLAKDYSTENSGRFVNGVLAAVADAVRPL